ncbi:2'-5' RNA ligase family protein [Novosphingobium sp.]|uniref:2'-5' RNA ligase family protein n=1 Tax=Novosphingobium sp. TaxID=1874826 RepID=UPI0031E30BAE
MMLRTVIPALLASIAFAVPASAEDTVSIDIYAIPSRPVVEAVAQASKDLAKHGLTTFYAQGHAVHATLYLTQYPASAEPELKAAIARLAKGRATFPLALDGTERTASNWLFLKVKHSADLQRLADQVTLAAEPLRDHHVTAPGWMRDYPAKLPAFERYGSPNVFMQFEPHLTLLANEKSPALSAFMAEAEKNQPQASGQVEGIGIGVVDANGQIVKTLAEFHFTKTR